MIKGVRWHFVVLFVATSLWVASSLNVKHRQKRQLQNTFFLQPLRKGRYLPPLPIRIPPHSQKRSETTGRSAGDRGQSPWIPLQSSTSEEVNNKNVYVPPIRPPAFIATRKPPKTTFDIPLTKSIQVSPAKSNIQTTGYIRKNLVKVHATRTTTEHPRQKMLGTLAESTVQTILNFTPVDEGWRPKSIPTTATPNSYFGKNLGSKVDKHLNYTGVRFGKVNTVLKTKPQNDGAVRLSKNETNFVMKFTPEDVKFTSVEVKTEKINAPFSVDSPEIQHLTGGFDERRPFFDGFSNPHNSAVDLRNEGNIPYQGHKTSMENESSVKKTPLNTEMDDSNESYKTIFDIFSHTKTNKIQLPGQESFMNIPFSSEKTNPPFAVRNKDTYQKDRTRVSKPFESLKMKNEDINKQVSNDNRNFFTQPSNVYGVDSQQQVKSNLPYQGHARKPPVLTNANLSNKNTVRNQGAQTFFPSPSSKPVITRGEITKNRHLNDQKALKPNVPFISGPQHMATNYSENAQFLSNKDSSSETSSNSGAYRYDSVLNSFPTNRNIEKDALAAVKNPLTTRTRFEKNSASNITLIEEVTKNNYDHGDHPSRNFNHVNSHKYSPKSPPVVPITHEEIGHVYEKDNDFAVEDQLSSKPAFEEEPNLKEIQLQNPPKYLQFHDEDFLKPVIPLNYEKDADISSGGAVTFSSEERTKEVVQQNSDMSRDKADRSKAQISASKVEYYKISKSEEKKPLEETLDSTYFQPVFPDTTARKAPDNSRQRFQNYDTELSTAKDTSEANTVKENSKPAFYDKVGENYLSTLQKISKDVIITKESHFSPKDAKRNGVQRGRPGDFPRIVTPPPVITMSYDSAELLNRHGGDPNRTENYAIQLKPALSPESTGRPRKPNITISTGMLAGILIAALVFLGFLTGSIVYAFHQWKFGRSRSERQKKKKTRSPGFPPEYLDDNLAGNTYIHNNIFLPTPQNLEERNPSDPDNCSVIGDEEQPAASTRGRRHRRIAELNATRREP